MKTKNLKRLGKAPGALLILFFITGMAFQTQAQRNKEYILKNTNVEALRNMAASLSAEYHREYDKAVKIAKEKGWPIINLVRIDERGLPVYDEPTNVVASAMTNTTALRNDFGVQGNGMNIGMWEASDDDNYYAARATHQDLTGRVTIQDGNSNPASHATHVAGTLIGNGFGDADAKGMAPQATLDSYSSGNDLSEMALEAANGLLVSNHSYGNNGGWTSEGLLPAICPPFFVQAWTWQGGPDQFIGGGDDPNFGQYNSVATTLDNICRNSQLYLPLFSAGNYNNSNPIFDPLNCSDWVRNGTNGAWEGYIPGIHPPGNSSQTSTITTYKNAKNILTVGNLQDDQVINASSSRGMTDDGRIKPDICGNGTSVYSTESSANDDYGEKTGTSMASPNVAGSLLLLQQLYEQKNGNNGVYMRSATLKALAIHTATDLGNPGPDFTYGWGLLNASKAGMIINRDSYNLNHRIFEENNPYGFSFTFFKDGHLIVTLCYTDVAGPALVNDLDLTIVKTGGSTYYPYILDMNNPSAPAITGDNDRDNVEQIDLNNEPDGEYTVYVNVEGSLTGNQPFSLIVSGIFSECGGNTLDLGNNIIEPDIYYDYEILCQGTIQAGTVVKFVAGNHINLSDGFNAEAGSEFNAVVLSCD